MSLMRQKLAEFAIKVIAWVRDFEEYFITPLNYTKLHEEDDWVVSINLDKDDPDHFVIISYNTLDDKISRARVARKPIVERIKELENKHIC